METKILLKKMDKILNEVNNDHRIDEASQFFNQFKKLLKNVDGSLNKFISYLNSVESKVGNYNKELENYIYEFVNLQSMFHEIRDEFLMKMKKLKI